MKGAPLRIASFVDAIGAHMLDMLKGMEQVVLEFVSSCVQTLFLRSSVGLVHTHTHTHTHTIRS